MASINYFTDAATRSHAAWRTASEGIHYVRSRPGKVCPYEVESDYPSVDDWLESLKNYEQHMTGIWEAMEGL